MAAIIDGILNWFVREYFSNEFSGGDALSLAILLVLALALLTRRSPNIRTSDILALKGDVNQIKGQMGTLISVLKPVPAVHTGPSAKADGSS